MKVFQARAVMAAALFAVSLAACSGGGVSPDAVTRAHAQPNAPSGGLSAVYSLSPSGGRYSLPLPQGYSGSMSLGASRAPQGAQMRLDLSGNGLAGGAAALSTTSADPFPIFIGIALPFTITLPVPGFSITFPHNVNMAGTFDLLFYDPTKPANAQTNPSLLGQAVVSGHTLTFTAQPNASVTLLAGVRYTFIIARNIDNAGTNSVILPVQSGVTQTLASVGPLGALANYQASVNTGFLEWQTISGSPPLVPQIIFGDQPIESIVVSASQALTLTNTTITGVFANGSGSQATSGTLLSPKPGTFVPDANPTIFGPFPATVYGNKTSFTVPPGLALGGNQAWDFSLVTVTACAPLHNLSVCNDGTTTNLKTSVLTHQHFNVLVSDSSGLLTQPYSLVVTAPCTIAGINENDNNGDVPSGYNDNTSGPNAEFDVSSGASPGTCTITATYNGVQVAQTSMVVNAPGASTSAVPFTLRPPVNAPAGFAVSGKIQ
ncbi:MAG: hypothetical protein DLM53_05925 [Candidatus Eremiobacter antarcticus]|nr:hypothetical protein [Candidatus Eremiobacteraeota bacterium]PZR62356.1 MAG: hypothetical protein DLM53_05925 [Candidatus Eremiobacter sp. RRmetagenome_bin22]